MKTTFLKWMLVVGGACLATAVIHPRLAHSADHLDAPATSAEAAADINDVYAFTDGNNAVFAMTVFPAAPATAKFSNVVQYVIHTSSGAAYGATNTAYDIICQFDADAAQKTSCWAGANEYVTGDASTAAGITSKSGKLKVFAGLRKDPFFFNLLGFREAVKTVKDVNDGGTLTFTAGCPDNLTEGQSNLLVGQLSTAPGGGAAQDFFKDLSTLAIVVSLDKTLVTAGGPIVSTWGSTHRKQ